MERPVAYNLLRKDELIYEVVIRDTKPKSTFEELRVQIRDLASSIPADEILDTNFESASELNIIETKLTEILNALSTSPPFKSFNRFRAVAHHLFHRFSRVVVDDSLIALRDKIKIKLHKCLVQVDGLFKSFCTSFVSPSYEEQSSNTVYTSTSNKEKSLARLNHTFDGKSCIHLYLIRLDELCSARNISEDLLFQSAVELFTGHALIWYRSVRSEIYCWSSLKEKLIEEFTPLDYDDRVMTEIRRRTQGSTESSSLFISTMLNYFSRLSYNVSEVEQLKIIRQNLRPNFIKSLALESITTIQELKNKCKLLEYSFHQVSNFAEPPKATADTLAPDLTFKNVKTCTKVEVVQGGVYKLFCVRCRTRDHTLKTCKSDNVVCFRCGSKGFTKATCTKCNKNLKISSIVSSGSKN